VTRLPQRFAGKDLLDTLVDPHLCFARDVIDGPGALAVTCHGSHPGSFRAPSINLVAGRREPQFPATT
jgi:hypothetical protein